jgi:hypothetical protein
VVNTSDVLNPESSISPSVPPGPIFNVLHHLPTSPRPLCMDIGDGICTDGSVQSLICEQSDRVPVLVNFMRPREYANSDIDLQEATKNFIQNDSAIISPPAISENKVYGTNQL